MLCCVGHWSTDQVFLQVVVQSLSRVWLVETPWTAAHQAPLSSIISWSLLTFMSPLLLPSVFSSIRVFSNKSTLCIRWPKYWSFSFSISPSNAYSGLISFSIDWCDLLSFQGILKSLLQLSLFESSLLVLSLLYGPTLTSVHDYWKKP